MPAVQIKPGTLKQLMATWNAAALGLPKSSGEKLGLECDRMIGAAVAVLLGGIPVKKPASSKTLLPPVADCVEVGPSRVIGGIRPQNFDVVYRPDGLRYAHDTKTLNSLTSFAKNYQNMINDLGTEAATVHTRFPFCIVSFLVAVPAPCLGSHTHNIIATLTRLSQRQSAAGDFHKAEAIAFMVFDPPTGNLDATIPAPGSCLRLERFSEQIETAYVSRYAGMPPHAIIVKAKKGGKGAEVVAEDDDSVT